MTPAAAVLAALLGASSPSPAAETAGSCAACHRASEGEGGAHGFADWEGSPHARAGVACQACHGGDASRPDKTGAHAGLKPSTDPDSPVYFTRVPETCGACHEAERKAFAESAHGRELRRSGKGPNCVTCHGSMANRVLAARDMEMTCTLCHRRPTQAFAALMSLGTAGSALRRLEGALQAARGSKTDLARQERERGRLADRHRRALEDWHTFRMAEVIKDSRETARRAAKALTDLKLKRGTSHE